MPEKSALSENIMKIHLGIISFDIAMTGYLIKKTHPEVSDGLIKLLSDKEAKDGSTQRHVLKSISVMLSLAKDILKRKNGHQKDRWLFLPNFPKEQ